MRELAVTVRFVYISNRILRLVCPPHFCINMLMSRAVRVMRRETRAFVNVVMMHRNPRLAYVNERTYKCLISGIFYTMMPEGNDYLRQVTLPSWS